MFRTIAWVTAVALATVPAIEAGAQDKIAAQDIPPAVTAAVRAAQPDLAIVRAELKEREGRRYYDVEGVLPGGEEMELDLLQTRQSWAVVEIQRDIAWAEAPEPVRSAAGAAEPVRVIESRQAADGAVIYELFAPGRPAEPSLEVRWKDGVAEVLSERWPH